MVKSLLVVKKTIKDVAGYNTAGIIIASEGTLAIITEITLKLIPKPKFKQTYMGVFPDVNKAMNAVFKSLAAGANPVAMEFLDALVIKALKQKFPQIDLPEKAGGILVGDVDGNSEAEIKSQLETLKESFAKYGSIDFIEAKDEEHGKSLWFARRNASPATMIFGTKKIK